MDFTLKIYSQLLGDLQNADYYFQTCKEYMSQACNFEPTQLILLCHDVDKLPHNSLRFAQLEAQKGIKATYYFRMDKHSYNEELILQIANLGHEIGYHYETMDTESSKFHVKASKFGSKVSKEQMEYLIVLAYEEFCINLNIFRAIVEIKTISMHGNPLSPYDNRAIWSKYDYRKLGIIAEPYFDLDFNELYYITDTGRCWDGNLFNVRGKATKENPVTNEEFLDLHFHSTRDIIKAIHEERFPKKAMLNFHPQRWNKCGYSWIKELVLQNAKNQVKRFLVKE